MSNHTLLRACLALGMIGSLATLAAADVSKEACLDSHGRGQDAKEQGKISLARKLFLTCAQPSCPALVQGDCARFADDLTRLQPSLGFVARDGAGRDLPDTTVYVDDVLVATRLDDGKSYDVDPGKHAIKFQHGGKDQVQTIVVGTGEKGRTVTVQFGEPVGSITAIDRELSRPREPAVRHPAGAKALIGVGAALAVGGTALAVLGVVRVPGNCSISSHECAAPPGDESFDKASSGTTMLNAGMIAAGVGVVAVVGGVIWYTRGARPTKESARQARVVTPWLSPDSAGLAISGRL